MVFGTMGLEILFLVSIHQWKNVYAKPYYIWYYINSSLFVWCNGLGSVAVIDLMAYEGVHKICQNCIGMDTKIKVLK